VRPDRDLGADGAWASGDQPSRREIASVNLQLRDANESLEQRVAERTAELSDALVKLKESEAMLIQSEKMASWDRWWRVSRTK